MCVHVALHVQHVYMYRCIITVFSNINAAVQICPQKARCNSDIICMRLSLSRSLYSLAHSQTMQQKDLTIFARRVKLVRQEIRDQLCC